MKGRKEDLISVMSALSSSPRANRAASRAGCASANASLASVSSLVMIFLCTSIACLSFSLNCFFSIAISVLSPIEANNCSQFLVWSATFTLCTARISFNSFKVIEASAIFCRPLKVRSGKTRFFFFSFFFYPLSPSFLFSTNLRKVDCIANLCNSLFPPKALERHL